MYSVKSHARPKLFRLYDLLGNLTITWNWQQLYFGVLSECVRLIQAEKDIFILKKVKQKISDHSCLNLSKWLPETFLLLVRPNHQLQLLCVYLTTHSDIPIWHQSIQVVRLLVAYSARYWTADHTTNKHWYTETFFLGWTSTCLLLIILGSLGGNQTRNPWVGSVLPLSQVKQYWFLCTKIKQPGRGFSKGSFFTIFTAKILSKLFLSACHPFFG